MSWTWGDGPPPQWAHTVVIAVCMANLGRKPMKKISGWVKRHFKKRNKRICKEKPPAPLLSCVKVHVSDEVSIEWEGTGLYTVTMPRDAMTPGALLLMHIHDC